MTPPWRRKKHPKPTPYRMDEDSGAQVAYEDTRMGRGRRASDQQHGSRVEFHPLALLAIVTVLGIIGYFWKGSQDNTAYEIHQLRISLEQVLQQNAKADEWKTDMSRWRDQTDTKLDGLDQRLDTLQARQNAHPFPWQKQEAHPGQN